MQTRVYVIFSHTEQCCEIMHMTPKAFINLCQGIRGTDTIKDAFQLINMEQVVKFLHILDIT